MIQQIDTNSFATREYGLGHRAADVARARAPTAVLIWIGMLAVYGISAVLWLSLLRHGYPGRRG